MSAMDDELTEILGDFSPDASGRWSPPRAFQRAAAAASPSPSRFMAPQRSFGDSFGPRSSFSERAFGHRGGEGSSSSQQPWVGRPRSGTTTTPAPAGQPYAGAVPIPPGNWGGGTYPPPGWSPGQPLPGYPQGWPPPGSPWPGNFTPGLSNVPAPTGVLTSFDPYGNPVFTPQPGQAPVGITYDQYGNPIYPPGMPQPTIDVTVGEAMASGMKMTEIIGCLRGAGYTSREINGIVGRCCGW